jgi:hypothetical protein
MFNIRLGIPEQIKRLINYLNELSLPILSYLPGGICKVKFITDQWASRQLGSSGGTCTLVLRSGLNLGIVICNPEAPFLRKSNQWNLQNKKFPYLLIKLRLKYQDLPSLVCFKNEMVMLKMCVILATINI